MKIERGRRINMVATFFYFPDFIFIFMGEGSFCVLGQLTEIHPSTRLRPRIYVSGRVL